ncbi:MAG: GNAT family N-acetyltransferase [Chloroflexi bacterium]|nr:GNAT family N-acetyltransferase [Chloroflexota bacterium]
MIREASPADAMAVAKVQVDSWRSTYPGIVPQDYLDALSYEQRATVWSTILSTATGRQFVFVAEDPDRNIVGFASGGRAKWSDSDYEGELSAIYLLESHQHKGLGRLLTARLARHLLDEDINSMLAWVLAANPSRPFYEALGARQVSERDITIGGTKLKEVSYGWPDLNLVALFED